MTLYSWEMILWEIFFMKLKQYFKKYNCVKGFSFYITSVYGDYLLWLTVQSREI